MNVHIYTDGSCNNRKAKGPHQTDKGIGGVGIVIIAFNSANEVISSIELSKGPYCDSTSARMEIKGVIEGLSAITRPEVATSITIFCDNQYVVNTIDKGWLVRWLASGEFEERKNIDLWIQVLEQYKRCGGSVKVKFKWIKGHNNHTYNERCDELANQARKRDKKPIRDNDSF